MSLDAFIISVILVSGLLRRTDLFSSCFLAQLCFPCICVYSSDSFYLMNEIDEQEEISAGMLDE